ncbi:hypothetical protein BAE44_0009166 [Dichanthelium oligosanthes]|uniref:Photolyase/cryptochrome alpha/beta domain-containing protein n=1 Tax=Dichanthelium oligosanthes TaxID=888268 RepID=A0A1E5VXG6_9POAL|nr:hypothetical protein BAE44_0009166 [Dichanthelium oligosanthes]
MPPATTLASPTPGHPSRVRILHPGGGRAMGPVVYWMLRDQRLADNWALVHAAGLAAASAPAFALFPRPFLLGARRRQLGYLLRGLRRLAADARSRGIPFFLLEGGPAEVPALVRRLGASALVADFSPSSGWSALPPELADLVLRRLPPLADRVRFTYVCRHWLHTAKHYSLPSLTWALPWLNFRNGRFQSLPDGELHSFRFREYAFCYGCFGNWLLFEEAGCRASRRYYLKNPFVGATKRLPGHCKEPVNLIPDGSHGSPSSSRSTNLYIRKVIMCSRDLVVAKVNYQHRPDAVVCCRPGMSSSWSMGLCNGRWYQDMAFYEGKPYTVTVEGDLFAHEVTNGTDTEEPRVSRRPERRGVRAVRLHRPQLEESQILAMQSTTF